jgi:hypothetical protein
VGVRSIGLGRESPLHPGFGGLYDPDLAGSDDDFDNPYGDWLNSGYILRHRADTLVW